MTAATPWGRVSRRGELFGLSFERIYSSTPEDVWEAVTDAERLARWMAPYRGDLRLGGRWEALDSEGSVFSWGTVSECEPPRRFVTSWEYEGEEPSRLEVLVEEHPEGARLKLRHEGVPDGGYGPGWQTYLEQLDEHVGLAPSAVVDPRRAPGVAWDERYEQLLAVWREILP